MKFAIKPVILCGGSGTRLWPVSRACHPKQFIDFPKNGKWGHCLFDLALNRLNALNLNQKVLSPLVVALHDYRFLVIEHIKKQNTNASVFLEPSARNTAASLTMAALANETDDPILVVLPSDQVIDDAQLCQTILIACEEALNGSVVLLGVRPTYPETGYGYIKTHCSVLESGPHKVESFIEKPDLESAKSYLKDGNYLWNSGIFVLKSSTWLNAIKLCRPDIESKARLAWNTRCKISTSEISVNREIFESIPIESIDYAVIEKAKSYSIKISVIPFEGYWSDLGSWKAIFDNIPKDNNNNFLLGNVIQNNSQNCLAVSLSRPIALNKVNSLAVIETCDSVLVTDLRESQSVKDVVSLIKAKHVELALHNRKTNRPWGWFETLESEPGFKVKHIFLQPGQRISLQRHKHRAETWTVVKGVATVQLGEQQLQLTVGETIHIRRYQIHRLINNSQFDLHLIETQIGDILSEDDIERFDDQYGRT